MNLILENQEVVLYIDNLEIHRIMIADLDRIYLFGEIPMARHILITTLLPRRDLTCLYRLGKIIQSRFPESIHKINWRMTYYFVEFEDYISNLAAIHQAFQPNQAPINSVDWLFNERINMWEKEQRKPSIRKSIATIVNYRLSEYGIQASSIR